MTRKYVWLNLKTGEFSDSWTCSPDKIDEHIMDCEIVNKKCEDNWKLIEFNCLNDDNFEFSKLMKLR